MEVFDTKYTKKFTSAAKLHSHGPIPCILLYIALFAIKLASIVHVLVLPAGMLPILHYCMG